MQWYFVENGQKNGPHEESAFEELIRSARVGPKTLVWRAGMENWMPLEEVRPPQAAPPARAETAPGAATSESSAAAAMPAAAMPAAAASAAAAMPSGAPSPSTRMSRCGICGIERSSEDLMRFRDTLVCPACKPAFVQRMREGTSQPGQLRFAGFWIRVAAKLIDGAILGVVSLVITLASGAAMAGMFAGSGDEASLGPMLALQGVIMLLQFAVQVGYVTYFLPRYAATPGKMATGLIVVRSDASTLTAGRAFGRCFGEWLSGLTLGIGYLMAAFDEEKRALHDRVCDTRVAYKASRA